MIKPGHPKLGRGDVIKFYSDVSSARIVQMKKEKLFGHQPLKIVST